MPQGRQTQFLDQFGDACEVPLAAAMSDKDFCYVDDERLYCAGLTYTQTWGTTSTDTGFTGVTQVHLAPTVDISAGNAMWVVAGGEMYVLGYWNYSGQFGNGTRASNATFAKWGTVSGIFDSVTGTTDSFCTLDAAGDVSCGGDGYGLTPVSAGTATASILVDTFGTLHTDSTTKWRASAGRAECTVGAGGLDCRSAVVGSPGHVVDGTIEGDTDTVCWLEDDGKAWCQNGTMKGQVFKDQNVLFLAANPYTDSRCAIYEDGSLSCFGSNTEGKLGTGSTAALTKETTVLPAGTFDTTCR